MKTKRKKKQYSFFQKENRMAFRQGLLAGIPIGLGYFAVAFSLGIAAGGAGLSAFQGFLASITCLASAGEHMGFLVIAEQGGYLAVALATLVANGRYLLMSCALSQRMDPDLSLGHRMLVGYGVTDEIFGITIARPSILNPWYTYGALSTAAFPWALGTALGIVAGNLMPARIVSALSVSLYGMFLAVFVPPTRKSRMIMGLVLICFAVSFAATKLPWISSMDSGTRTILLTVAISVVAAILFPRDAEEDTHE